MRMGTVRAENTDAAIFRFDQSGALLRKVMESAAVGMTLVGVEGRMIYANQAYESMLGYEPGECLSLPEDALIYPDDFAIASLHLKRLLDGEVEEFRNELRLRHKDGSPIWVLASASLLRSDATNRPLYAIVQVINIDRQKRAEEALAQSESRLNFALEAAKQGVWDHDIRTDGMYYSRMWRRMRGFSDDEPIDPAQEVWLARVHPDDVPKVLSTVKKQDSGEDGHDTLEYRERHRDGHYMWILSRGRPVEWDKDGTPIRTVGTDTDITRLKETEFRLAEEKERLRVTLESIGDGVISTDAAGLIEFMNPVAEALTGWTEAEAMERPLWQVFVTKLEATGEMAPDVMGHCLASGAATEIDADIVLVSRDGIGRGVSGIATPVRAEDNHTIGAVLVFKDVTDHQAEQRKLAHSATHDVLTGLPNRSAFARALAEACRQAGAEQRSHALLFIDLDRFKPVNDTAGHAAGDALLQQVGKVIRACCRTNDFAARMGGDEFVVLLADCSIPDAKLIGEKLARMIDEIDFSWNSTHYSIGASVGIAPVIPDAERDVLAMADAACYAAKASGRGRVVAAGD
jgi:diguanylate cyclase (GGDEF)-like protein/PAS domain S-box-containing protein